jgi:hypothetical protein
MTILDDVEAIDHYRKSIAANPLNARSRSGQAYELVFATPEQQARIREISRDIPLMKGVMVVMIDQTADGGFPHTRPLDCVCVQPSIVAAADFDKTLIHESIHIHQRRKPELWHQICRKEGWEPVTIGVPQRWQERCRINPDTMATPFWAWEGLHVPLPMFRTDTPGIADVDIMWWDRRMGSLFHEAPKSFSSRYGRAPAQPEHPYELMAVDVARKNIRTEGDLEEYLMS